LATKAKLATYSSKDQIQLLEEKLREVKEEKGINVTKVNKIKEMLSLDIDKQVEHLNKIQDLLKMESGESQNDLLLLSASFGGGSPIEE